MNAAQAAVGTAVNKVRSATAFTGPLGLYGRSKADPAMPDVRGQPPAAAEDEPPKPMRAARKLGLDWKLANQARVLSGPSSTAVGAASGLATAQVSDEACAGAIDALFPATHAGAPSLGQRLLQDFTAVRGDPIRRREAALFMALGLKKGIGADGMAARRIWGAIVANDGAAGMSLADRRGVNDTLRALAATDLAYEALWQLKQHHGHAEARFECFEEFKFALQATDKLLELGVNPGATSARGIEDFVAHARATADGAPKLGGAEAADVLACRTLLCARRDLVGKGPRATSSELAAYMAWRNGFRASGPGSDFNKAVHRLHKFTTWVLRAQRGPTTPWEHVKEAIKGIKHAVARTRMSPLEATQHGTMGAELGELHTAKAAFQSELRSALFIVHQGLEDRIATLQAPGHPMGYEEEKLLQECHVRRAVLEHWGEAGRKSFRMKGVERRHIGDRLAQQGHPMPEHVLWRVCGDKLSLKRLKGWAREALAPGSPALSRVVGHVSRARAIARAEFARPPAKPDNDELRATAHLALETEGVQFRHDRQGGVQAGFVFGVSTPAVEAGVNVGPVGSHIRARQATVRIGTTTIGSDVFIGMEKRHATMGGVAATVGVEMGRIDESVVSVGAAGIVRGTYEGNHETGVSLRVSRTVKNHRTLMGQAVDFLFDQVERRHLGHQIDASELWERFTNRFINEPDLAFNFVDTRSSRGGASGGVGAGARIGISPFTIGPFLSAGVEWATRRFHRKESGHTTSDGAGTESVTSAAAMATLAGTAVAQVASAGGAAVRVPAVAGVGTAATEINIGSETAQVRLTVQDGHVQPKLSLAQRQFKTQKDFLAYLESVRGDWQACVRGGKADVDEFVSKVRGLAADHAAGFRFFQERRCLTQEAADRLSVLLARRDMLNALGPAFADDAAHVQSELAQVLGARASWVPEKLAVSEAPTSYTERGLALVGILRSRLSATSVNRYLVQLKPAS